MATSRTLKVSGMTCEHCVAAVTEEISGIDGVSAVSVDLGSGVVQVTSESPIDRATLDAAVDEAGYELVD